MSRHPHTLTGFAAAITLALAGCAAPPQAPGPGVAAPERFAVQPVGTSGSALTTTPATLAQAFTPAAPLQALVDEVLAQNRDLRAAAARVRQADALAQAQGAQALPSASLNAGASRNRGPDSSGQVPTRNAFSVGTAAAWEIDLWGRLGASTQAAQADARSAARDRDAAQLSLSAQALRLQFELLGLGQRLQLAQETLQVQRQVLRLVKARADAGRATALDAARAQSLVSSTEASVPALRNQACLTRLRLDVLRGQAPADCALADTDPVAPMPLPQLLDLGRLANPAELLAQRPDVQAAAERAQAAAARAQVAWAQRWPSLRLSGQIGWSADTGSALFKNASLVHSLGAALNWNWLDFGQRRAESDAARAGFDAAVAQAEQAQLSALEDAQASLFSLRDVELQAAAQAQAANAATQARKLAAARFDAGVADFFSLLDAERERLAAQDRAIQLQVARANALLAVHQAFAARLN
jgi:NodT family efflux transporter outer membrane factor (OMF) lipoprotein